jgi:hypothetical protein
MLVEREMIQEEKLLSCPIGSSREETTVAGRDGVQLLACLMGFVDFARFFPYFADV